MATEDLDVLLDSQRSEGFVDSEIEVSDDDLLFDGNIDDEVEWGDLSMNKNEAEASNSQLRTNEGSKLQKSHPVFNHKTHISDPKFELGMRFHDIATLSQIRQHSIKQGRDVKFTINLSYKVQSKCKHGKCPWVIYASKLPKEDTVQVKTYNGKHKGPRTQRVSHATTKWFCVQHLYKEFKPHKGLALKNILWKVSKSYKSGVLMPVEELKVRDVAAYDKTYQEEPILGSYYVVLGDK
ncbi:hypothetical protein DH2020_043521 [Rehmannia glutinosa]|uniref:Transposase MuDR plant domain-containing protein n=1 Tax=Rehmannia glutinosa TaxID=99300 RepID=A0ABR0UL51_REHGL